MRISDWSSDVCSSDLARQVVEHLLRLRDTQHLARLAEAHAACDQIYEQQIRRRPAFDRRRPQPPRSTGRAGRREFPVADALPPQNRGVVAHTPFEANLQPQTFWQFPRLVCSINAPT